MSIAHVALAVTPAEMWGGVNHWVAGAGVLLLLLAAIGALLAFGAGREHS
jgi:hypothetical protein